MYERAAKSKTYSQHSAVASRHYGALGAKAAFHLTQCSCKLFHSCCLSNIKQRQMMPANVVSAK